MNNLAIGVFDSGLGGLTAVKAAIEIMPYESIIYFGDTINNPYGNKNRSQLLYFTNQGINLLSSLGVKVILSACGTMSSYLDFIESDINIFGVIRESCKTAVRLTKNRKIGILGTQATINSNSYVNCISKIDNTILCISQACPLFVPMIENGYTSLDNSVLRTLVDLYVSPLVKQGIDTLILGCTHYPIIEHVIKDTFGDKINLVNPSIESIKFLKNFLIDNELNSSNKIPGSQRFYVSGDKNIFAKHASVFLEKDISNSIENVKIENFKNY